MLSAQDIKPRTTLSLTPQDREIIATIRNRTGTSTTGAIRIALYAYQHVLELPSASPPSRQNEATLRSAGGRDAALRQEGEGSLPGHAPPSPAIISHQ